ncbi:MAG: endonuclease III [Candidatus Nanoarchaeia archaeon]|jgi:endonuclease III
MIDQIISLIKKSVSGYELPLAESQANPFQVLVATMLSARTKDETTAKVCKGLFKRVKQPSDFSKLSISEIESLIRPVNYYKTKAQRLKELSSLKNVPETIKELTSIKGVGRKTANIVLNVSFNKPAIAVDTHVHRIMNRLNYVKTKTPKETELALREKLPKKHWNEINHILVLFGQHTCTPISPHCSQCPIKNCPRTSVTRSR